MTRSQATTALWIAAVLLMAPGHEVHAQSSPAPAASSPPAAPGTAAPVGELKPLGSDRYQIGRIVLDKKARRFTVPGRVHVLGKPLEYLATSPGGMKEYETLLELDASGSEFNLACILLGLERDPNQGPYWQFSKDPLSGPRVELQVAWQDGGKRREVSAAEALGTASRIRWMPRRSTSSGMAWVPPCTGIPCTSPPWRRSLSSTKATGR